MRLPMVCWLARVLLLASLAWGVLAVSAAPAGAEREDARKHYDRATAAFGLGRYADAAVEYEAAFRLRPDPALLYNCAQSYRLAGNKPRSVELYRNYVRLYGDASNAEDARKHLNNLELEIAAEREVTPRSLTPLPPAAVLPAISAAPSQPTHGPARPPAVVLAAPVAAIPPPAHLDVPAAFATDGAPDSGQRSIVRRPWFWIAIGAVVVGGTVAIIAARGGDQDPKPTLGVIVGN